MINIEELLLGIIQSNAIQVEVEAMKVANQECILNNEDLKYTEYDFECKAREIREYCSFMGNTRKL